VDNEKFLTGRATGLSNGVNYLNQFHEGWTVDWAKKLTKTLRMVRIHLFWTSVMLGIKTLKILMMAKSLGAIAPFTAPGRPRLMSGEMFSDRLEMTVKKIS
jgi:hypothetical protein